LRAQLDKDINRTWMKDLTGIYLAASYKIMKQDDQADKIFVNRSWENCPTISCATRSCS